MAELVKGGKEFIGYEYQDCSVPSSLSSLYLDSYPCFGWEPDPNMEWGTEISSKISRISQVGLRFRRDRKICNKMELTRLQRNFDGCVSEIKSMEKSRTSLAVIWAMAIGLAGTVFMTGSVFAITAQTPSVAGCVLFAIPGFIGWILPYFIYEKLVQKQTQKLAPLIEQKYDEIYEICKKGNRLLV